MRGAKFDKRGILCKMFGATPRNAIIELFLESRELDFAVSSVAEQTGLNRMTAHNNVQTLVKEKILVPTRKVSGSQMYALNGKNEMVKAYLTAFDKVLLPLTGKNIRSAAS